MKNYNDTHNKITCFIATYNDSEVISRAIDSVLNQKTNFNYRIVLLDDASRDGTKEVCKDYEQKHPKIIEYRRNESNLGIVDNIYNGLCSVDTEFFTFLEGDDYWINENHLQSAIEKLEENTDCVMFGQNTMKKENNKDSFFIDVDTNPHKFKLEKEQVPIFIHFSARVYRNIFDFSQYNKNVIAWSIGLYYLYLDKGYCYYSDKVTSVFDADNSSYSFSKRPDSEQNKIILELYYNLNLLFNFKYDAILTERAPYANHLNIFKFKLGREKGWEAFIKLYDIWQEYLSINQIFIPQHQYGIKYKIVNVIAKLFGIKKIFVRDRDNTEKKPDKKRIKSDLIIMDDAFPHPLSSFRYAEYTAYLEHFDKLKILCSGSSLPWFKECREIKSIIQDYIQKFPEFKNKLEPFNPRGKVKSKLVFVNFLGNIRQFKLLRKIKKPFVFTLYPGGFFQLNDAKCDKVLKKVFSSKYFRKVIVTQQVTYDYLIQKGFCSKDQIEFIFGVVIPDELLNATPKNQKRFGIDKDTLDICFVAHKYMPEGKDKGYDKFIDVAKRLAKVHDNIKFHVVGSFDEDDIDVTELGDKIKFYGLQQVEWFKPFYADKDIILSPNIPFTLGPGFFDGFPTACVTDAGLNEVAMFATDELSLNQNRYQDGKEIVIIKPDADNIIDKVLHYYNNPEELNNLSKQGREKILELYSYEKQIKPRIKVLEECLKKTNKG